MLKIELDKLNIGLYAQLQLTESAKMWKSVVYFLFLFVIVSALANAIISKLWLMVAVWIVMGAVVTSMRAKFLS